MKLEDQRVIMRAIRPQLISMARNEAQGRQMRGEGLGDIWKKIKKILGPIAKEVGPTVLKEFILPMALKKLGVSGEGRRKYRTPLRRIGRPNKCAGRPKGRKKK